MGKTIMVVDDSASVRQMVSFTIRNCGYDVIEAKDGQDALMKIQTGSTVHMIVTDLNMPNLDGVGLIKGVRSFPSHRFIPIIMLTTESQESKKMQGREAGATGWIVKPFKPEQLAAVVRRVLG